MKEKWEVVPNFPNYSVSNKGRVKNVIRNRILKTNPAKDGYPRVTLCRDGVYRSTKVHRLVATLFVPGFFKGAHVNHKDGVKHNNQSTNLEWATPGDNARHAHATGLVPGGIVAVVENGKLKRASNKPRAKKVFETIKETD